MQEEITIFWFRRDLRLDDNAGLYHALKENKNVVASFIFDPAILKPLPKKDTRVLFLHQTLTKLKSELQQLGSDLIVGYDQPIDFYKKLSAQYKIKSIYTNHDYEMAAIRRDEGVKKFAEANGILFKSYKDQCVFEKNEVVTDSKTSYTVYTPYKRKWLSLITDNYLKPYAVLDYKINFLKVKSQFKMPSLEDMGFQEFPFEFPDTSDFKSLLKGYAAHRDFPAEDATTRVGLGLRFGTVSIRKLATIAKKYSDVWLSELIWRDFFMQILWHYPHVETQSFRLKYEKVEWRKDDDDFKKWCEGKTGYPLVDAGMRQLNQTGYMHNRVRMVVASFLTKHLFMHWYLGERYFAEKLLDYDLSANNGNWQWAAGTGCDASPYFRIFNPESQLKKFDPKSEYVKKWVPEFGTKNYPEPMVEHTFARDRALQGFKKALKTEE